MDFFQYAQSSRFQVAFISNKHPQLVTKLFAIHQLAVVENINRNKLFILFSINVLANGAICMIFLPSFQDVSMKMNQGGS